MTVVCKTCNKVYKTYQSWYKHNKKFHTDRELLEKSPTIEISSNEIEKIEYICTICDKSFTYNSNCIRHKKKCVKKHDDALLKEKVSNIEKS